MSLEIKNLQFDWLDEIEELNDCEASHVNGGSSLRQDAVASGQALDQSSQNLADNAAPNAQFYIQVQENQTQRDTTSTYFKSLGEGMTPSNRKQ
ncbi:MAG: hypothetical protein AAGE84_01745 [Cyanobacteria bacterium P01_G01_bin.39]